VFASLIVPVFLFRHYIQDKGAFPAAMLEDMDLGASEKPVRRAGYLPYAVLAMGVLVVFVAHRLAVY